MTPQQGALASDPAKVAPLRGVDRGQAHYPEVDELLANLVRLTARILDVEAVSAFLVDPDTGRPILRAAQGLPAEWVGEAARGEVVRRVVKTGRPFLVADVATDPRLGRPARVSRRTGSFISLPLIVNEQVLGVLNVTDRRDGRTFGPEDLDLVKALVEQTALAVRHGRLLGETRDHADELERANRDLAQAKEVNARLNDVLERRLNELTVLSHAYGAFGAQLDPRDLVSALAAVARDLVTHDVFAIGLADPTLGKQVFLHLNGSVGPDLLAEMNERLAAELAATGISTPPRFVVEGQTSASGVASVGDFRLVHLSTKGRVFGVAAIASATAGRIRRDDQRLFELLASQSQVGLENAILHKRTEHMAVTDGLTGLYSRRYFTRSLEDENRRARRYGLGFSIITMDVDDFKRTNDAYGHDVGDLVLVSLARLLKKLTREVDIVARCGGEEFAVIVPETNEWGARTLAEQICRQAAMERVQTVAGEVGFTLSMGVASFPSIGPGSEELVRAADQALYEAKRTGKNRVCIARPVSVAGRGDGA